ncbi:DUF885 domain-containing protein [Sphingomonas hankyongi]|uniref:DUF885 family protein n=1 Tax=Sphingomonas hankyongi TaxID=2908209 RepID=A0ABT0RYG7_9SPHN|nr:DUF885 family protein [Sphingomonas hankyongi]MCL6728607.1 DUF885 family protein [Sphingomonas hankyongi]
MDSICRREFLGTAAAAGLLAGCKVSGGSGAQHGNADLAAQLQGIAEQILAEYPQNATILGIAKDKLAPLAHQWQDQTPAGFAARREGIGKRLATLKSMDLADLSVPDKLNGAVALQAHELAQEGYAFGFGDPLVLDPNNGFRNTPYVVNQLGSSYVDLPDFLESRHTIANAEDAAAFADRVDAYARNVDGETERLKHDRGVGVVAPNFNLDKTIAIISGGASEDPEKSAVLATFRKKMGEARLSDDKLAERVKQSMATGVIPALQRQVEELKQHRAVAKSDAGVWHFKNGEAYYRWALKAGTTTTRSPQEIHQLGLDQVKTIQARMEGIMQKQGLTGGTVGERMAALGKDPAQLYPNTAAGREQLLAYLNGRIADVRTRLPRAFATMVPGRLIIKRVPPAIEAGAPGGYAAAGSIDGKVPGQYYINLRDTSEWPKFSLPTLCYHEGIPGHVWQGDYANRMPLIRSMLAFNAYSEGWALYAEQLADELGVYADDPLGQLGYLQSMGFRACRLVVDTGLHAMQWTRDQATDWFVNTNGDPRSSVQAEVDRYCAMPGQACGYKVGQLEIVRLRDKAQAALGAKYDLRRFDDAVVLGGSVPMTLLETVIDGFIAKAKG